MRATVIALSLCLCAPGVADLISPTSQSRSIEANAAADGEFGGPDSDSASMSAPDFGPFDESIFVSASSDGSANARATQTSSILADSLLAAGLASSSAVGTLAGEGSSDADSSFLVAFDLTQSVTYTLTGTLGSGASGMAPGFNAAVTLTGPDGVIVTAAIDPFGGPTSASINEGGVLAPGAYTLSASAGAGVFSCCGDGGTSGSANFDLAFSVVPEPASMSLAVVGLILAARRRPRSRSKRAG